MSQSTNPRVGFDGTLDGTTTTATITFDAKNVTSVQLLYNQDGGDLACTAEYGSSNFPKAPEGIDVNGQDPIFTTENDIVLLGASGTASDEIVHIGNNGARWGRVLITRTGGSGRVMALICSRGT